MDRYEATPHQPPRSSSRPVSPPRVPQGGPLRELKLLLHRLYVEAGTPPYTDIAAWMSRGPWPLGKTAVNRYLREPELPPDQAATIALAAVLAGRGPRDVDDARDQVRRLWLAAHDWTPLGTPIDGIRDPFALEVHEAITVADRGDLPVLPPYIERAHDRELRTRIAAAVASGRSQLVTLVGGSSTGKTRACWEALHATDSSNQPLLGGWRLWHPFDPTRPEAALAELEQISPHTVVWLNEAQFYLLTGPDRADSSERRNMTGWC